MLEVDQAPVEAGEGGNFGSDMGAAGFTRSRVKLSILGGAIIVSPFIYRGTIFEMACGADPAH